MATSPPASPGRAPRSVQRSRTCSHTHTIQRHGERGRGVAKNGRHIAVEHQWCADRDDETGSQAWPITRRADAAESSTARKPYTAEPSDTATI